MELWRFALFDSSGSGPGVILARLVWSKVAAQSRPNQREKENPFTTLSLALLLGWFFFGGEFLSLGESGIPGLHGKRLITYVCGQARIFSIFQCGRILWWQRRVFFWKTIWLQKVFSLPHAVGGNTHIQFHLTASIWLGRDESSVRKRRLQWWILSMGGGALIRFSKVRFWCYAWLSVCCLEVDEERRRGVLRYFMASYGHSVSGCGNSITLLSMCV